MAVERQEPPSSFMYEPSLPPTIPPGVTVRYWRGRQARRGVGLAAVGAISASPWIASVAIALCPSPVVVGLAYHRSGARAVLARVTSRWSSS